MSTKLRISASSLKALTSCSLSYYYSRILKLPEKEWPRTIIGSLAHSIFENLRHPRHRDIYDAIVTPTDVDYARSPALARLVSMWQAKYQIAPELLVDLNGMLYVGLVLIDFHWTKADKDEAGNPKTHGPEHEFKLTLEDGTEIKGFIDDMAEVDGAMTIRDFKSQRNRFAEDEVINNVQALVYQLYVWQRFGMRARVEFILLRHPPTKRTPTKHLQVVEPASESHMQGLMAYAQAMSHRINQFSLEDAYTSPMADFGFCQRVCTHYAPHPYWVVCAPDDPTGLNPFSSHLSLDKAQKVYITGQHILERRHPGCALRYKPND